MNAHPDRGVFSGGVPPSDGTIALRPWTAADVPAVTAACQDDHVQRWTTVPANYTLDDGADFIAGSATRRAAGETAEFAVVPQDDPAVVLASIALVSTDWPARTAELGYWVAPSARRQGHASAALRILSQWALDTVGFSRLYLKILHGNEPSKGVAANAGYALEALHPQVDLPKHGLTDVALFVRTASTD